MKLCRTNFSLILYSASYQCGSQVGAFFLFGIGVKEHLFMVLFIGFLKRVYKMKERDI